MATEAIRLNSDRLLRTKLSGVIQPTRANEVVGRDGRVETLPGQGGVVLGIGLGDRAGGWRADHLEPGISLGHPDPAANRALQILSCVGNRVVMLDGPAAGAEGIVYGKHGAVLALFADADVARMAPGEWATIEAQGVGLALDAEPDLVCHSCSPALLQRLLHGHDATGRLTVPVRATLPAEAAAAGLGMMPQRFNIDLHTDQPPVAALAQDLRFGDVVAVRDQDHRFGREYRAGWLAVGVIVHGVCIGGGHGFGFTTLFSAPAERICLVVAPQATLARLLDLPWVAR